MSSQLDRWCGEFGDEYLARNVVDPASRRDWFGEHIPADVSNVLEVGANRGHNLVAIKAARPEIQVGGIEPNAAARAVAAEAGIGLRAANVYGFATWWRFDLVFTSGVLIHVPPDRLDEALSNLYAVSARYVLAIEYRRDTDTRLEYRGHDDMLWAGDYGARYRRLFPDLEVVDEGELTEADGFADSYFWLLRKGAA